MSFDATRAIYGQGNASQYLKDVKNGVDCLDVVMIGDSNTGFGAYGWHEGLAKAFIEAQSAAIYATPLAPFCGETGGNPGSIAYRSSWTWAPMRSSTASPNPGIAYSVSQTSLTTYGGMYDGFLRGDTDPNCAKLRESFNIGVCSGNDRDGANFLSTNLFWGFGFTDSSTSANAYYYSHVHGNTVLASNHPFIGQQLTYRVVHSRGLGGGTMTMNIRSSSTDRAGPLTVATDDGGAWRWSVTELEKTSTGDSTEITCSCLGLATAPPTRTVSGNVGFLFHSAYRKVKGIAVNNLMYMGGRTSGQLATILTNTSDKALTTYMSELIGRQRAAGGSGRLLFFIQAGTNDSGQSPQPTSQAFLNNIRTIIDRLALAYNRTGDSTNSPAFMVMVSHPMSATDADDGIVTNSLTPYREVIALNSGNKYNQLPCDFVNLLALNGTYATTYNRLFDQSLYNGAGDLNHLLAAGYDELSAPLAQAVIDYVPPASTRKIDVSDGRLGVWHRIDVLSTAVVKDRSWLLANADSEANAIGMLNQCWTNLGKAGSPPNRTYFTREDAGLNDAATLPGAPSAPTSSSVTSTEITVNIDVASATFGGSLPTAVRVRAIPTIAGTPTLTLDTAISYPWPTTAKTVNTLTANTSYNVSYALINAAGTGTYSTATAISTAP